jgi:tetratricopeptide (TPR) repeat protein
MPIDIAKTKARIKRLIKQKNWSKAAREQLSLARAEPLDVEAWIEAIRLRRAARENEQELWDEAAQLTAGDDTARTALREALAQWHGEGGRWAECVQVCDEILREHPRHHSALEMRAAALLHSGDIAGATGVLRLLLRVSPRDPLHRLKLATLLQLQDQTADAAREYEYVLAAHPNAPFTSEARGALELLDNIQSQQILMRAAEDVAFRRAIETSLDEALHSGGFYLSENARENLRQNMAAGNRCR